MRDVINAVPYKYLNKSVGDTSIALKQSPARRANIECDLSHTRGPGAQPLVTVIKLRFFHPNKQACRGPRFRLGILLLLGKHKEAARGSSTTLVVAEVFRFDKSLPL